MGSVTVRIDGQIDRQTDVGETLWNKSQIISFIPLTQSLHELISCLTMLLYYVRPSYVTSTHTVRLLPFLSTPHPQITTELKTNSCKASSQVINREAFNLRPSLRMGLHPLWLYCGIDVSASMNRPFDSFKLIQLRFLAFSAPLSLSLHGKQPWQIQSIAQGWRANPWMKEGRRLGARITLVRSAAKERESGKLA